MKGLAKLVWLPCVLTACGPTAGSPVDGRVIRDLSAGGGDLTMTGQDLRMMPGADLRASDLSMNGGSDINVAHDLSTSGDGSTGCTHISTWAGLNPIGGHDPYNGYTAVASTDQASQPYNALVIEDWHYNQSQTLPLMTTFSAADNYATCVVCAVVSFCDQNGCSGKYFAQAGSVNITRADQSDPGRMVATATNLKLVEWDFSAGGDAGGDRPIPGGACLLIDNATFDVSWDSNATDGGMTTDGGTGSDLSAPPSGDMTVSGCTPVINELMTTGVKASDEFVEVYNPCSQAVDLTGWILSYRSAGNNSGGADSTLLTFLAASSIAAGGYLVVAGSSYSATTPDYAFASGGLAQAGGAVALRNAQKVVVDSVAYDTLTTANNFTEGSPAPNPPANQSIARHPNGSDTHHNATDFQVASATPGAANP